MILSVRSFFKMHLLRQFFWKLDEILTQCSSVLCVYIWSSWRVDKGSMTSLQRANLITYQLVWLPFNEFCAYSYWGVDISMSQNCCDPTRQIPHQPGKDLWNKKVLNRQWEWRSR